MFPLLCTGIVWRISIWIRLLAATVARHQKWDLVDVTLMVLALLLISKVYLSCTVVYCNVR